MTANQNFLEIVFASELLAGDLKIIKPATTAQPGLAKLNQATVGPADPTTPNSRPVLSRSGAKFGFIAKQEFIDAPYSETYKLNGDQSK